MKKHLFIIFLASLLLVQNIPASFAANGDFSDVPTSHPNYTSITYLKNNGIIQGYPDGTFKPSQTVNRVEALKIIMLGSGITVPDAAGTAGFKDAEADSWYAKYLIKATQLGIVKGYADNTFKPAQTVNLVENLKILLLSKNIDLNTISVGQNPYADAYADQWYAKYAEYAKEKNLIDADGNNMIFPAQGMTRAKLAEAMYRLIFIENNGLSSYPSSLTPPPSPSPTPPPPSGTGVNFTIDPTLNRQGISPYIYGSNELTKTGNLMREPGIKITRLGGNRWTAYNWENNASNAGMDWGPNASDGYLSDSETPGDAVKTRIDEAFGTGADALVTVPIVDYVAADKDGNVTNVASDTNPRWKKNLPTTSGALPLIPNVQDGTVYQDQFVNWIQNTYKNTNGRKIFFDLDNEPGIWPETHPLVHPKATTYAEMAKRTTDFSKMIKSIAPNALVFGAVAYGYNEYISLQGAPDQNGRDYLDFFLDNAKSAGTDAGKRLVDVLDLHWYPEAKGGGLRITSSQSATPSDAEVEARIQAPRSLWDPTYVEDSWITNDILDHKAIKLIPWLKGKIADHYPGTKLSFSEYEYGGANHISGGIAEADALGIFGREGVFAALLWPEGFSDSPDSFVYGAFDIYLNYDGQNSAVGDISVSALNSDTARTSAYAMIKTGDPNILYIIAINKTKNILPANIILNNALSFKSGQIYQLTKNNRKPKDAGALVIQNNQFTYQMPDMSVSLLVLKTT